MFSAVEHTERTNMNKKVLGLAGVVVAAGLTLSACDLGYEKITEPFNDAKRAGEDSSPALIITFPDGFSNQATKCVKGVRYTSAFKGDHAYGAISMDSSPTNGCQR